MIELCQSRIVLRQWWWDGRVRSRATYGNGWPTFKLDRVRLKHSLRRILSIRLRWQPRWDGGGR